MRRTLARVDSLSLEPSGRESARLACTLPALSPGQALLALQPGRRQTYRLTLYPSRIEAGCFSAPVPAGEVWAPGDELDLLGPVGSGFDPPAAARRWFLAAPGGSPRRLLPLVQAGLERGAALSLWTAERDAALPAAVELSPDPAEAAAWADFIAVDLEMRSLDEVHALLEPIRERASYVPVQALAAGPLPCGVGACGACALRAKRGWKLACLDGPVFDLAELGE